MKNKHLRNNALVSIYIASYMYCHLKQLLSTACAIVANYNCPVSTLAALPH